jgi:hypothetical protein
LTLELAVHALFPSVGYSSARQEFLNGGETLAISDFLHKVFIAPSSSRWPEFIRADLTAGLLESEHVLEASRY